MMRGRNHRPGDNRALDYASVLSILVSSFVVVSLLLNRSTFESAVAAWTPISIGRATLCRTVPVYPPNSVEIRDNGLDTSHRFSLLQASNINGNNIEDVAPQSPSSLLSPLPTPFIPSSSCKVDQMSGTDLAYIGDVVYELFIRTRTVWPLKRTSDLQHQVVTLVRAEHQSKLLHQLRQDKASFPLTTKEEQVLNRGRNAAASRSNTNHRHHPIIYQDSTAFEALVGYLYISDMNRCTELFRWIESNVDSV